MLSLQKHVMGIMRSVVKAIYQYLIFFVHILPRLFLLLLPALPSSQPAGLHASLPSHLQLQSLQFPFLDPITLMLQTRWRGKEGKVVVSSLCGQVEMFLLERGWTGGLARTDCGYGLFECDVNHDGDMAIQMDIRRCRVQQFR